jgi:4-amino-4-deoxy-L-arabinose transferase-like glycosyltransferase
VLQTSSPSARFRAPRVIFWVAFLLRVACIAIGRTYHVRVIDDHFNFGFEAGRIARSLVEGHGYSNPFNGWSGPTAWVPPLYPLLLALAFKLFGVYTNAAAFFVMAADSLFSAAIIPAIYEIAVRCFDAQGIARRASRNAAPIALWSAWLWAVYPAALQYAVHWLWDTSLSAFLFTWTIVLALRLRGTGETQELAGARQWARWIAFGALWGLTALSNASLLIYLPAAVLWIVWPALNSWVGARRIWRGPALAVLFFAVVMTPWWVRNERALHAFVATRANLGAELYASTLPGNDAFPWGTTLPIWPGDPTFQLYARMGEVRYSQMRKDQAIARIRADQGTFWRHSMDRFLFFWINIPHPPDRHPTQEFLRRLNYSFVSLAGLMGLAVALRRRVPGTALMAWAFLLIPLPYYLITVQARFRHPLEPLITILTVYLFRSTEPSKPIEVQM